MFTYIVIHIGGTADICAIVVRPLIISMIFALVLIAGGVSNGPVRLPEQRRRRTPVPDLLRPLGICVIECIASETGRQLKQSTIGDGVFGIVTGLVGPDLPTQPAIAGRGVPARDLSVKYTLSKCYPRRFAIALWVVEFCSGHSGQTPEHLIIITQVVTVVGWEVIVIALLEQHALGGSVIVRAIAGPVPVLDQSHEHRTTFPPSSVQLSGNGLGLSRVVVFHHDGGSRGSGLLNRVCPAKSKWMVK